MGSPGAPERWSLTLYVSGASPHSVAAVESVREICRQDLAGRVDLQVVDVREQPVAVQRDEVVVVPTLVRRLPAPLRRLVGDLEDVERLRAGLDLRPVVTVDQAPVEEPPPP